MKQMSVLLSAMLIQAATVSAFAQDGYVDLGLSVKWATCNEGASTPLEKGNSYKWDSNNAEWNVFNGKALIKADGDITKLQQGGDWRTPSVEEMIELLSYCTWTRVDNADSCGFKITSNIEGFTDRSIFFPVIKERIPIHEIVRINDIKYTFKVVDSTYNYTGYYMTNFINNPNVPGYLDCGGYSAAMHKNGQPGWYSNNYVIRPVKPLDPQTKQNRVLPQVELRESSSGTRGSKDIDMSEFESLGLYTIDEILNAKIIGLDLPE